MYLSIYVLYGVLYTCVHLMGMAYISISTVSYWLVLFYGHATTSIHINYYVIQPTSIQRSSPWQTTLIPSVLTWCNCMHWPRDAYASSLPSQQASMKTQQWSLQWHTNWDSCWGYNPACLRDFSHRGVLAPPKVSPIPIATSAPAEATPPVGKSPHTDSQTKACHST